MTNKIRFVFKGGDGSGHFDHAGRPGHQGGSLPGGGGGSAGHADDKKYSSMSSADFESSAKNKKEKMYHGDWSSSGKKGVYTYNAPGGVKYKLTHSSTSTDVENRRNPNLRESGLRNTVSLTLERTAPAKFQNPNFSGVQVDRDIVQIYKKIVRGDEMGANNAANESVRKILADKFGITTS